MSYSFRLNSVDRADWLNLASNFLDYNYRQTWVFSCASAFRVGALSEHIAIECPERGVVALADVRIKLSPLFNCGIAYINGGPLLWREGRCQQDVANAVVDSLVREYVHQRRLTLRVAPPLRGEAVNGPLEIALSSRAFVKPNGRATIVVDISCDESEIRKRFHQKWRNCLNKSERSGLTVRAGKSSGFFKEFTPLFNDFLREKNFTVDLDAGFYERVQEEATEKDRFYVSLADYQGQVVAGHVASMLGDTCVYLLGAANRKGRDLNAAYFLQWQVIQSSKAAGCRWYDLGGIDPEHNPGVYDFKKRMGGQERALPGPYELHPGGLRTFLTRCGEGVYRRLKPLLLARL